MKKQKIRIMILLFMIFAVMLFILSFTNYNYSKKTQEEQMDMELEQLMFPGFRNGHDSLPSRYFSYVILEIGENNEVINQQSSPAWDYSSFGSPRRDRKNRIQIFLRRTERLNKRIFLRKQLQKRVLRKRMPASKISTAKKAPMF